MADYVNAPQLILIFWCLSHHSAGPVVTHSAGESVCVSQSFSSLTAAAFTLTNGGGEREREDRTAHLDLSVWPSKTINNYEMKWVIALGDK